MVPPLSIFNEPFKYTDITQIIIGNDFVLAGQDNIDISTLGCHCCAKQQQELGDTCCKSFRGKMQDFPAPEIPS